MNREYSALAGRIKQTLMDLGKVIQRAEFLMEKSHRNNDDGYLDGVALNLQSFYAGIERIFKDIARSIDQTLPTGPDWHQNLLIQMAVEISSTRPPVITQETRYGLDEYRAFRHVVHNVYAFNIRPFRLQELTAGLNKCFQNLCQDMNNFITFLETLDQSEETES